MNRVKKKKRDTHCKSKKNSKSETLTMAFEMPLDQIKQLQILLRREANLSWYEPEKEDHLSLPKLPSVAETVAKLDPSPPYLRCKNCDGRLLRGVQSSICAFCGANPLKDLPPEPIKFKNTLGYKWLLESLQLDGSEMVALVDEEIASSRGRSEPKDKIPLSELLDLEIRWPSQDERTLSSNSGSVPFDGKSSLNLAGVDLDNFFDRRESASDAFELNLASGRQVGDNASVNAFQASENLRLFQNAQASEVSTESTEDQSDNYFSGWEANFKSASYGQVNEASKSFGHSKVDLDKVSRSGKDSAGVKKNDDFNPSASTENDWFQVDGLRTSNSKAPGQTGKQELSMDLHDTKTAESAGGSSARNFDWMQDDQWHGSDNKTTATVTTDEADDSFDAWNAFTGSASTQATSSNISSSKTTGQTGKYEITADLNDTKTAGSNGSSNKDFDWMQDDQWRGSNNKTTDIMGTNDVADSFDDWNDFTGSANAQHSSGDISSSVITGQTGNFEFAKENNDTKIAEGASGSSRKFSWMQDDQWQGSNKKATGIVTTKEVSDSFDDWNDFTGSSIAQNPSSSVSLAEINGLTGKSETSDFPQTNTDVGTNTSVQNLDWMQDDQWQVSNSKSTDTTTTNEVADSFDVWNDFTSMATTQNSSSTVWKPAANQTSSEQTSELNLFSSSNNSRDADFGGFSHHDLFGQFNSPLNSLAATNAQSAAASTNRGPDVDAESGNSRDVSSSQVGSKGDDVEMLMSQMHDLSFMLESSLSIPPK